MPALKSKKNSCKRILLKTFLLINLALISSFLLAQKGNEFTPKEWITITNPPIKHEELQLDCKEKKHLLCNYIENNIFKPEHYEADNFSDFSDPFGNLLINGWLPSHGTPNIYDGVNFSVEPPIRENGYCRMAAWITSENGFKNSGEGIVQKIPALKEGERYALSFFKRISFDKMILDNFYIVLMHCSDFGRFNKPFSYITPDLPENAQIIYCEKDVENIKWEQVFQTFIAKGNYDLIWFFPKENEDKQDKYADILFAYPELINISNFNAGSNQLANSNDHNIAIGPANPNCSVWGSNFIWNGPHEQVVETDQTQQIIIDPSREENIGDWTLTMNVPGAVATNSTCAEFDVPVKASITVERPLTQYTIDCNISIPIGGCNYFNNNKFTPVAGYTASLDPFGAQDGNFQVPNWLASHGTPDIYLGNTFNSPAPPPVTNGLARMEINYEGGASNPFSEGIIQKIPALNPGHKYALSFFKKRFAVGEGISTPSATIDNCYIVLMKCSDYNSMNHSSYMTPALPANSQIVYCNPTINDNDWLQVVLSVSPNSNYDMIWIFPKHAANNGSDDLKARSLLFAYPELIDVTGFSAGTVNPANPQYPNCVVTIGPAAPNCTLANAVFTWKSPNNLDFSAPANQQFVVDASNSSNTGIWTLEMTIPNASTETLECGNNLMLKKTVNMPACQQPRCAPVITPAGPIEYWIGLDSYPYGIILTSDHATGNQWYLNNVLIPGATSQTYRANDYQQQRNVYTVINNSCISNAVIINYQLFGYGYHGEDVYTLGAKIHPVPTSTFFCLNTANNPINQFDLGPSANYTWNIFYDPCCGNGLQNIFITPQSTSPNSPHAQIDLTNAANHITAGLQGVADLNGVEKVIDYFLQASISQFNSPWYSCTSTINNIYASNESVIKPGGTDFDWEEYDFGPDAVILDYTSYITTPGHMRIPGRHPLATPLHVQFTADATIKRNFNYDGTFGGCFSESSQVRILPGCRTARALTTTALVYPNPANNKVTVNTGQEKILQLDITDQFGRTLKRIQGNSQNTISFNVSDLLPGAYNCLIKTSNDIGYKKIIVNH